MHEQKWQLANCTVVVVGELCYSSALNPTFELMTRFKRTSLATPVTRNTVQVAS